MTDSIERLYEAMSKIKHLGARQTVNTMQMSDMEARYAEEHVHKNICHMLAHEISDGMQKFSREIIQGRYRSPDMVYTARVHVITDEDYQELIDSVRRVNRFIDATTKLTVLNK